MEKIACSKSRTADFYSEDYSFNFDDSDQDDDSVKLGNTIFDVNTMLRVMDADVYNPMDLFFMDDPAEGHISLAYERLSHIPRPLADHFAQNTRTLDLSHNKIKDLSMLANFKHLNTLILDKNESPDVDTLPPLPDLQILWLNNCGIYSLSKWVKRIQVCCPNLRQLSLLGNPGVLSTFNGGSSLDHLDYRMYVIGSLRRLDHLDDAIVTDAQRVQAETHKSVYTQSENGTSHQLVDKFHGLSLFRYDRPARSRLESQTNSSKRKNKVKSKIATDSSSQG